MIGALKSNKFNLNRFCNKDQFSIGATTPTQTPTATPTEALINFEDLFFNLFSVIRMKGPKYRDQKKRLFYGCIYNRVQTHVRFS